MAMANLVWSIENGELDRVQEYIDVKQVDVNTVINGRSLVHYAADFGQGEVLSYLIEKGAKLDRPDVHGITPILAAIWEGHTQCVKMLIEKGASKSGKTPEGNTYLEAADREEIRALLQ